MEGRPSSWLTGAGGFVQPLVFAFLGVPRRRSCAAGRRRRGERSFQDTEPRDASAVLKEDLAETAARGKGTHPLPAARPSPLAPVGGTPGAERLGQPQESRGDGACCPRPTGGVRTASRRLGRPGLWWAGRSSFARQWGPARVMGALSVAQGSARAVESGLAIKWVASRADPRLVPIVGTCPRVLDYLGL